MIACHRKDRTGVDHGSHNIHDLFLVLAAVDKVAQKMTRLSSCRYTPSGEGV